MQSSRMILPLSTQSTSAEHLKKSSRIVKFLKFIQIYNLDLILNMNDSEVIIFFFVLQAKIMLYTEIESNIFLKSITVFLSEFCFRSQLTNWLTQLIQM